MSALDLPNDLTWTCHICGKERPDRFISVFKRPLIIRGIEMGSQNVRFCNDNPDCATKAVHYSFFKEDNL